MCRYFQIFRVKNTEFVNLRVANYPLRVMLVKLVLFLGGLKYSLEIKISENCPFPRTVLFYLLTEHVFCIII